MKPKEYLVKHGHLKEVARGRLSREHIAIIEKAVAEGVCIEGYSIGQSKDTAAPVAVKAKATSNKDVIEPAPYTYPESEYQAVEFRNGKRVIRSMRECCNTCYTLTRVHVSLVGHVCDNPMIVAHDGSGSVPVQIERIK